MRQTITIFPVPRDADQQHLIFLRKACSEAQLRNLKRQEDTKNFSEQLQQKLQMLQDEESPGLTKPWTP